MKFLFMDIKIDSETAIIFDLDDTLYNEIEFLKSAYKEIATTIDTANWKKIYSKMLSLYRCKLNVFDNLYLDYQVNKNDLIEIYRNHLPDIQPFPGVLDFLKSIKENKGFIGMVTDGRKITQNNKIDALGIGEYLDYIVISEVIGTEKPNKNNFKAIEKALNVENYSYVADNFKKDFITPKKMGWNTIALVDNGLNIHCNSYQYLSPVSSPKNYILSFKDFKVK